MLPCNELPHSKIIDKQGSHSTLDNSVNKLAIERARTGRTFSPWTQSLHVPYGKLRYLKVQLSEGTLPHSTNPDRSEMCTTFHDQFIRPARDGHIISIE